MLLVADWDSAAHIVEPKVHAAGIKTDAPWLLNYVKDGIRDNKFFLFMDTSGSDSFVVLSTDTCPYRGVRTLFVLLAYCADGDAHKLYGDEIDQLAREADCTEIEFISSRVGWQKAAKKYGYVPVDVTYRKRLNG